MIKKLLLLFCVATCFKATAQPTLTLATSGPFADIHKYYTSTLMPGPGPSGANQTWDFTTTIDTGAPAPGQYGGYITCPTAVSYCDTFVGSTFGSTTQGLFQYQYYKTTPTTVSLNGFYRTGAFVKFTDPEDIFHFPMHYNDNFNDTFAAHYSGGGHDYLENGRIYDTADAWGTLKLPNGTFANVLRVKRVEVLRDSDLMDVNGGSGYIRTSYTWYSTARHEYLLQIYLPQIVNGFPTGGSLIKFTDQLPTGISNFNNTITGITLSPNPAKENLNITFNDVLNEQVNISLVDMMGKVIMQANCASGVKQYHVNTSGIPSGVYFMHFKTSQGNAVSKVEIL